MNRIELNIADTMTLGRELFKADRLEDAAHAFEAVAETEPENWEAAYQIAFTLSAMKRYEKSLAWYERAMAIVVTQANMVCLNRSVALGEMGRSEEAAGMLTALLARQPDHAHALYNLGVLRMQMDDFDGALPLFERSLEIDPTTANGDARFCRGFARLVLGDYLNGFMDFEHRLKDNIKGGPAQGQELRPEHLVDGKVVLVLSEMGRGDMIQFGRYVPMLVESGAIVLLVADRGTEPLFRDIPGVTVFAPSDVLPDADYWCHMMGLAHVFETNVRTVPAPLPLTYDTALLRQWRTTIPDDGVLNVGLCWAGSKISRYDEHRTIPLELLKPLMELGRVRFFGLQQAIRPSDYGAYTDFRIEHIGHLFRDFRDTAHAMKCLDLVITVDTSVAHMAGTVGVQTWVLLTKFRTYWLWLKGRTTTPWYPSFTLIRQGVHGDWPTAIETVRGKLLELLAAE